MYRVLGRDGFTFGLNLCNGLVVISIRVWTGFCPPSLTAVFPRPLRGRSEQIHDWNNTPHPDNIVIVINPCQVDYTVPNIDVDSGAC